MSFSPLNFCTFAAARGQFLRPDVQALLDEAWSESARFSSASSASP
jgi:hypothetical protein